jgi:hypothetical protein
MSLCLAASSPGEASVSAVYGSIRKWMPMSAGDGRDLPGPLEPAQQSTVPEFAGYVLNRLVSVRLSLESARSMVGTGPAGDRIAAATDQVNRMIGNIGAMGSGLAEDRGNQSPDRWPLPLSGDAGRTGELLGSVVRSMFNVRGLLQDAADLPQDVRRRRIAEALRWLEDLAGQIRDHVFTQSGQQAGPGPARRALPDRSALLGERAAHTAWALQAAAADAAVLLEQQADLARQPGWMDYPAQIKRWRAFADQAEQMARRWEQPP